MKQFFVDIVARDEQVYSGDADYLSIRGLDGILGIMADHAPMVGVFRPGICVLRNGDENYEWAMSEGFVSVAGNRVTLAVAFAYTADEIDASYAEDMLKKSRERLSDKRYAYSDLTGYEKIDMDFLNMLRAKAGLELVERHKS